MSRLFGRMVAAVLGAAAVALAAGTPAHAASFRELCELSPENYGDGAVVGVFTTEKRGLDQLQVCRVYDSKGYLRGTHTELVPGHYRVARPATPAQVKS